jgi:hypothetical protein
MINQSLGSFGYAVAFGERYCLMARSTTALSGLRYAETSGASGVLQLVPITTIYHVSEGSVARLQMARSKMFCMAE